MPSMNLHPQVGASNLFQQAHQGALCVMWSTMLQCSQSLFPRPASRLYSRCQFFARGLRLKEVAGGGPWVSRSGVEFDGICRSPQLNAGYRPAFPVRNIGLPWVSMFGAHQSVPLLLECHGPQEEIDAASSLEYTTVFASLPFLLPPFLPFTLPPSLLTLTISPLTCRPSLLPLHFSSLVSFPNRHITTLRHSVPNRIVELTPMICGLLRKPWMVGGGDLGWRRNGQ
jgi:hypothetical protein